MTEFIPFPIDFKYVLRSAQTGNPKKMNHSTNEFSVTSPTRLISVSNDVSLTSEVTNAFKWLKNVAINYIIIIATKFNNVSSNHHDISQKKNVALNGEL